MNVQPFNTDRDAIAWFKAQWFDTTQRLGKQYIGTCPSATFKIRKHHIIVVRLDNYGRETVRSFPASAKSVN